MNVYNVITLAASSKTKSIIHKWLKYCKVFLFLFFSVNLALGIAANDPVSLKTVTAYI